MFLLCANFAGYLKYIWTKPESTWTASWTSDPCKGTLVNASAVYIPPSPPPPPYGSCTLTVAAYPPPPADPNAAQACVNSTCSLGYTCPASGLGSCQVFGIPNASKDYAALIQGIATGTYPSWVQGPTSLTLNGSAFPVLTNPSNKAIVAAARTGAGRIVMFGREGFIDGVSNSNNNFTDSSNIWGTLLVNAVKWASGTSSNSVRVATVPGNSYLGQNFATALRTAAVGIKSVPLRNTHIN